MHLAYMMDEFPYGEVILKKKKKGGKIGGFGVIGTTVNKKLQPFFPRSCFKNLMSPGPRSFHALSSGWNLLDPTNESDRE
jgi:hypothetical protein